MTTSLITIISTFIVATAAFSYLAFHNVWTSLTILSALFTILLILGGTLATHNQSNGYRQLKRTPLT